MVQEHIGQGFPGLVQVLSDDHAFSGGQAVILENGREGTGRDIGQGFLKVRETAVSGRGNAVLVHQFLGKLLGAFDGRRGLRVAENRQPGSPESVGDAGGQGGFGTHHG